MMNRITKEPRPLFKYVTAERALQILTDRTIRFTQPALFNDPFEFFPALDIERIKIEFLGHNDIRRKLAEGYDRKVLLKNGLANTAREYASRFTKALRAHGVLSLSSRCDIPLMWSHYAANHTGVVIGFNLLPGIFPLESRLDANALNSSNPIIYSNEKPKLPSGKHGLLSAMFTKDACWAYEEEWRVVRNLRELEQTSDQVYVARFEKSAVRCVISGPRMTREMESKIFEVTNEYDGVHQLSATLDADQYSMDIDTHFAEMLRRQDYELESSTHENVQNFYQYISEAKFFTALEMLDQDVVYEPMKAHIDFNP